jgi:hypothetical protein
LLVPVPGGIRKQGNTQAQYDTAARAIDLAGVAANLAGATFIDRHYSFFSNAICPA